MKIDIKSIVKTLSAGGAASETADKPKSIREAIDEMKGSSDAGEAEELETAGSEEEEPEKNGTEAEAAADVEPEETEAADKTEPEAREAEGSEEQEDAPEAEAEADEESDEETDEGVEDTEHSEEAETAAEATLETEAEAEPEDSFESEESKESSETEETAEEAEEETAEPEEKEERLEEEVEAAQEEPAEVEAAEAEKPEDAEPSRLRIWGRSYGWITGIAASFLILMAFMVIYTTMTPREIHGTINGEEITFTTEARTIEDFLESEKIAFCEEDYLSVPLTAFIQKGLSFELVHAKDFTVTADGKTKKYKSLALTVEKALDDVGVEVGKIDIVKPKQDTLLTQDMSVIVKRVVIKKEVVEKTIPFKTIQKDDVTMMEGKSKVVKKGRDGLAKITYKVKYIDGKEASRKRVDRKIITQARDKVVANGTRVNYNGKTYSRKLVVRAYAYTGGGTTAMGTRARVGEIAVDPSVIPLGTNVYIEGVGPRRAEDTGGNIKGNTIDIYMDTQQECINWGMRYVTIYIE